MTLEKDFGRTEWDEYYKVTDEGEETDELDYVTISWVYVKPEHRGKGLARPLIEETIREIKKQYGKVTIKIVPEPKSDEFDIQRLGEFYESISGIDEVVAV